MAVGAIPEINYYIMESVARYAYLVHSWHTLFSRIVYKNHLYSMVVHFVDST